MKNNIIKYYALITQTLFIFYNLVFRNLIIEGLLSRILMCLLIAFNIVILVKNRKSIKYKSLIIVVYFFLGMLVAKNSLQFLFSMSTMTTLMITGFIESTLIKIISTIIVIIFITFFIPLCFAYLLIFGPGVEDINKSDIYESSHYYCDNNYEIYSFSKGGMDSFHYSIGKHYEIVNINNILHISYSERKEKSREEYHSHLKNHNCRLVEDDKNKHLYKH